MHIGAQVSVKQKMREESSLNHTFGKGDIFSTPVLKPVPSAFVVKRSHQSRRSEFSPLPNTFGDIADEDTWLQMNKGFVADLDSLHITPARKDPSFPSSHGASVSLLFWQVIHYMLCLLFTKSSLLTTKSHIRFFFLK